ncbi:MAG: 3-phosphoglycerate dehydrogenase [Evtepia sp.]|uniref:3-phosphoglycerate dehydrogenase n=1 Tax=Evtepia sp. TaxID=2773933 RepID=UPI002A765530|nr:3-phosphoglycerate dehydrogenase [Evtepia sp.]MDY3015432.1 3-phosphoglycerate dehydrogenase [Evtepia sp.]
MYHVKTMNKISKIGLAELDDRFEISDTMEHEDAILVRSAKLHDYDFPAELQCIARAGAGVNNIPLDRAADAGVVVFNTPGANANGVKELTIASLLLASRKLSQGISWVKEQAAAGADVAAVVEKSKSAYVGPEIMGKTLGVVGLGAIGVLVANAAAGMGMKIVGYDPFLSVQHALNLVPGVEIVDTLEQLYGKADYITLHLPMNPQTKGTINADAFAAMKDGVRIVNLARGELVDTPALKDAMASGKCAAYVTDFPNSETAAIEGVVAIPHLGASTPESEDNCAMMAARQVKDYLDNGNIVNSVNLPVLSMAWAAKTRVCVITKGADAAAVTAAVPGAVATASKTRGDYGYFLMDTNNAVDQAAVAAVPGVLRVRVLEK